MGARTLLHVVRSIGMLSSIVISAPPCADKEVFVDGQVSNCSNARDILSGIGLGNACNSFFCASCAYANACDASCGFCQPVLGSAKRPLEDENYAQADIDNACSDNNLLFNGILVDCATAALAVSAHGLEGACPAFFCASCAHAHACDKSCGLCEEHTYADSCLGEEEREIVHILVNTSADAQSTNYDKASIPTNALDLSNSSISSSHTVSHTVKSAFTDLPTPPDWWPCSSGELLDCQGRCRSSSACNVAPLAYTTCLHWISDGTCDDGCYNADSNNYKTSMKSSEFRKSSSTRAFEGNATAEKVILPNKRRSVAHCGRRSDEGKSMAWNCPLYGCDGGDCEVCQGNPPGVPPHAMAPRHLLTSSATSAGLAGFGDDHDADLSWLWPGLDQHHDASKSVDDSNDDDIDARAISYRAQCRNMPLHVAGGATITCAEAIAQGLATCKHSFCDGCGALAGACDEACNYCQRGFDAFQGSWPGRSKPWLSSDAIYPLAWPSDFTRSELPDQEKGTTRKQPPAASAVAADADSARIHSKTKSELAAAIRKAQADLGRKLNGSKAENYNARRAEDKVRDQDENRYQEPRKTSNDGTTGSISATHTSTVAPKRPVSWVIVLTVCLSPLPGMTHTVRSLPQLRLRDYARALRRWAGDPNLPVDSINGPYPPLASHKRSGNESEPSTPWPLVVVESSGANLTALRWAVAEGYAAARAFHDDSGNGDDTGKSHDHEKDAPHDMEENGRTTTIGSSSPTWRSRQHERRRARRMGRKKLRPIEFVSLQLTRASAGEKFSDGGDSDSSSRNELSRGKGVAEAASIVAALEKSEIVRKLKPTHAVKVTGRYFVRNLDEELHRVAREAAAEPASNEISTPLFYDSDNMGSDRHSDLHLDGAEQSKVGRTPTVSTDRTIVQAAAALWPQESSKSWPLLALQSTPSPWNLWDGVVRSEVVGFALYHGNSSGAKSCYIVPLGDGNQRGGNYGFSAKCSNGSRADDNSSEVSVAQGPAKWAEAVFANQNEAVGRPMERVLFENARTLSTAASSSSDPKKTFQVGIKAQNDAVMWLNSLEIDSARNAEDDIIVNL